MSFIQIFRDDTPNNISTEIVEVPLDLISTFKKVTRVEVIDKKGRSYVNWNKNNQVKVLLQDNGRTMKVVISNNKIN